MLKLNDSSSFTINRAKRTWVTIPPNIIQPTPINMFVLIMFTWIRHPLLSLEQLSLVLGKGELKPYGIHKKAGSHYQVLPTTEHEISPTISLEQLILPIATDTNISQTEIT
jgi:hypothetical protein